MKDLFAHNLTRRFLILMGCLVLFTAFSSQAFFSRQERTNLETRLREKASFINRYSADRIAAALIQKDDITLLHVINQLEEDQEIFSVVVVDQRGSFRYHRDPEKVGTSSGDQALLNALKTGEASITMYENSGGKAIALLTPMVVRGLPGPLGAIRIDLTYRSIEQQVTASRTRFWFVIIGSLVTCTAFVTLFVGKWVLTPLQTIKSALSNMNPATPEPVLTVTTDEFGSLASVLNELLNHIRTEMQHHLNLQGDRGEHERSWISNLARALLPGARVIIADKDNRIVLDTEADATRSAGPRQHLLDLIADSNFGTILTGAFQKEGVATRGAVTFQGKSYNATILSVPVQQSLAVKTLIALQPK